MKKNLKILIIILVIIVLAIIISIILLQKPKNSINEVEFLTSFQETEDPNCSPRNYGVFCKVEVSFIYEGKEYVLEERNGYEKANCKELLGAENCGDFNWKDNIDLEDGKINIKGLYDSKENLLYNYSILSVSEKVSFLTSFSENETLNCVHATNTILACDVYIQFDYQGKKYYLITQNLEAVPNCLAAYGESYCDNSSWKDRVNLIDGKITIEGLYNSKKNLLYNYSISSIK